MYDSYITVWIFITLCVTAVVVIIDLFLYIETYADKKYGHFQRITIWVVSIVIIGITSALSYFHLARFDIVTNTLITEHSDRPVRAEWNNALGQVTYRPTDDLGRPTGAGVRFNACMPVRTQPDEPVTAIGLPHNDEWVSAPLVSSQLWASTNTSNVVPMTKETQSSLYNIIEYEAFLRFQHDTNQSGDDFAGKPFPPDVCAQKSFEFNYTVVPVYVGNELIPREFVIDMFATDGYANHIVLSNGVPGKTINYTTGEIR